MVKRNNHTNKQKDPDDNLSISIHNIPCIFCQFIFAINDRSRSLAQLKIDNWVRCNPIYYCKQHNLQYRLIWCHSIHPHNEYIVSLNIQRWFWCYRISTDIAWL
jgi:hypothetical protein